MKVKAAGIFLVNTNDKILVGHPTNHDSNVWSIPKGRIDDGETPLEAAIRETYEETNFKLFKGLHDFEYVGEYTYNHKKKGIKIWAHFEKEVGYWDNVEIECNSNVPEDKGGFPEMDDFKWITLDETKTLLHKTQVEALPSLKKLIDRYRYDHPRTSCSECDKVTIHRVKFNNVNGAMVCNKCDTINFKISKS